MKYVILTELRAFTFKLDGFLLLNQLVMRVMVLAHVIMRPLLNWRQPVSSLKNWRCRGSHAPFTQKLAHNKDLERIQAFDASIHSFLEDHNPLEHSQFRSCIERNFLEDVDLQNHQAQSHELQTGERVSHDGWLD